MEFPIKDHISDILATHDILPHDRFVEREDIDRLSYYDIKLLQKYFFFTFPEFLSKNNYICIIEAAKFIYTILDVVQDKSVILCPGDSGSKLVQLIKILFHQGNNIYIYEIEGKIYSKEIIFVIFPLSHIYHGDYTEKLLDEYLIKSIGYETLSLGYPYYIFDYINTGSSVNTINRSLMRTLDVKAETINLKLNRGKVNGDKTKIFFDNKLFEFFGRGQHGVCIFTAEELFSESERYKCRCIDKYTLIDNKRETYDIFRCNVVITLMVLVTLIHPMETPNLLNCDNCIKKLYKPIKIIYYDLSSLTIKTKESNYFDYGLFVQGKIPIEIILIE